MTRPLFERKPSQRPDEGSPAGGAAVAGFRPAAEDKPAPTYAPISVGEMIDDNFVVLGDNKPSDVDATIQNGRFAIESGVTYVAGSVDGADVTFYRSDRPDDRRTFGREAGYKEDASIAEPIVVKRGISAARAPGR